MANIVLRAFGGMIPRYGGQLIPDTAATLATNALLLSGELRGLHAKAEAKDLRATPFTIKRIYKIPHIPNDAWVTFPDETVDMVKGPLVNDAYNRYYITSENDAPRMNTEDRLANEDVSSGSYPLFPHYLLGVPGPTSAITVTPSAGGVTVTRAYTYTFVSKFGEESQPSEATIATGDDASGWVIAGMDTAPPPPAAERDITHKNIYRTVTANNGIAQYHLVAQVLLAAATYTDNEPTAIVSLNTIIESEDWAPPPASLRGILAHPNGFLVGFTGRDIYFSEPYRPHAWPAAYVLSTQDPIVGLGLYGTTIVITTRGFPYTANGIRPDGISFTKSETPDACVASRRAIVSMPFGVYYPSDNGLVLVSPQGFNNATKDLLTKDEWQNQYFPGLLSAARWQSQYVAFYDIDSGFMFAPDEPKSAFVELGHQAWSHDVMQEDYLSGDVWLVEDNVVYYWNPPYGVPQVYTWRSKEFVMPKPVNFSAFRLEYDALFNLDVRLIDELLANNALRFPYPLNPLNFTALNSVRKVATIPGYTPPPPTREFSQPMHKSPLYVKAGDTVKGTVVLRLYADDSLVYEGHVEDQGMYRLPAGFKAARWYVEVEGNVSIKSIKIAETGKGLAVI